MTLRRKVCRIAPLHPARLRRPDSDERAGGPFSYGRRSERDGATPVANARNSKKRLEYQALNGYEKGKLTGCI